MLSQGLQRCPLDFWTPFGPQPPHKDLNVARWNLHSSWPRMPPQRLLHCSLECKFQLARNSGCQCSSLCVDTQRLQHCTQRLQHLPVEILTPAIPECPNKDFSTARRKLNSQRKREEEKKKRFPIDYFDMLSPNADDSFLFPKGIMGKGRTVKNH